ncbi:erythromycin esterase [Deinococcus metalli]|uniref:Erythromycin esterase n=1 Tax=Deinococcus metalli TaxID=1141878 RepID=A0A7W8NT72_9DEIO|nr:erythromycin esterase family protein [Deinococcus metalli]MBB5378783.1 erythromycin esterase [Deinococcus metalli]GHF60761.1 hypothetical protein GCM10017781_41270 [Deinococcus metalli]
MTSTSAYPRLCPLSADPLALPDADFLPLLEVLRGTQVVGLGEPTHGTHEAFVLKHRLLRLLADRGLLRVLAFECAAGPAELIDAYVRHGEGDARTALLAQEYWIWETAEVLAVIEWLSAYNARLPEAERVRFVGVDVQRPARVAIRLAALLLTHEPDLRLALTCLAAEELPATDAPELVDALRALETSHPLAYIRHDARHLRRHAEVYLDERNPEGLGRRDRFMAEMLLEALTEEGLTVLWAHNEHVAVSEDFFGSPALGYVLREALGEGYLSLGMLFGEGELRAKSLTAPGGVLGRFRVEAPKAPFVEVEFLNENSAVFDLMGTATPPRLRRFLGTRYDEVAWRAQPEAFQVLRPLSDFDLLAWWPRTTAAAELPDERECRV